jgi:hypothetical protein
MPTRAKLVKPIDAAWAAGFLDGEGYIGVTRDNSVRDGKTYYKVAVSAGQIHKTPIELLQSMFGGRIVYQKNKFKGCWHWRVFGENAYSALRIVLPYLVVKRQQAELVLQFGTITPSRNPRGHVMRITVEVDAHRRALWAALCELNGGRALQAERLSEEARTGNADDDAIVRTHENSNRENVVEIATSKRIG